MSQQITKKKRINKLTLYLKHTQRRGGRNNQGVITAFHRGGGNKKIYRLIDFRRSLFNIPGIVQKIEYDPNRTCKIALVAYKNGILSYIIAPSNLSIGDKISAGQNIEITIGNALPLENIPIGTLIHNIELKPGHGGQIMRAAGTYAKLIKKVTNVKDQDKIAAAEGSICTIRLYTGKLYKVSGKCMATIGVVSNETHKNDKLRKAGQNRWRGKRPTVRGVAMNPVDHPHGGGEGKSKGGRHPVSPWGKLTKGYATSFKRRSTAKRANIKKK